MVTVGVTAMPKSAVKASCKNIFKQTDKDEIQKVLTEKWIKIIKSLEQASNHEQP